MRNLLAILLASAASLAAQSTIVIPPIFANVPAASTTLHPFGSPTVNRAQYCYDVAETGLSAVTVLKSLEVRSLQNAAFVAKTLTVQIEASATSAVPSAMSTNFATNRGVNHAVVFTAKPVNLPATTVGFVGTWSGPMVFDTPFSYDPAAGNLLFEFDVSATTSTVWSQNATFTGLGTYWDHAPGCANFTVSSFGGGIGGTLSYSASYGYSSGVAVLILGAAALPVPIQIPNSPTCFVHQTLDIIVPTNLNAAGAATHQFVVPNIPLYRGASIFGQYVQRDPFYPSFVSTASRRVVLQGLHIIGRCFNETSNTSPTGTAQFAVGLVLRLGV